MTQFQFDMICKIINNGAPALADELCDSLNNLVVSYNKAVEELQEAKVATKDCESASNINKSAD